MRFETKKRLAAREVLRLYGVRLLKHPYLFSGVILGGIVLQLANVAAPLYLRNFFNTVAAHTPGQEVAIFLYGLLTVVGIIWFVEWASRRMQDVCNMYLQSRVMADLFDDTFGYLIQHSYNFFISNFAGSLTHKVSKYIRAFEILTDSIYVQFLPTFYFVLGAVLVLGWRNIWLGTALGLWCVLFFAFQIWASHKRQHLREERAEADTRVTASLADAISNQSTILMFSGFMYERKLFRKVVEAWRATTLRSWLADAWIWSGIGLLMIAIEIGLLAAGVRLWQQGLFTVGDFVLIQAYLLVVFDRLVTINRELRRFYDAFADAGEMAYLLHQAHDIRDKSDAKKVRVTMGEIWFDDVSFHFSKSTPILKNFNLKIAGGERVALVGPSGAGKTTVTKLLLRLYDVKSGEIKIDGQNIAAVTQDSLREAIAFVPQEPILFHRSLMDNIRYGRRDASDEEVVAAAKKAHCHEFISKLADGYQTFVGERGVKLSGGERQRVAIARAILKNAPILVLDEATSSLDSESEALIQDALETLMQGKTVVVIAHRLSTIMKMDRIVVMQEGSIAAQGTHLELVNQEGLYRKLWSIQAGGFLGDGATSSGESEDDIELETDELAADEKTR